MPKARDFQRFERGAIRAEELCGAAERVRPPLFLQAGGMHGLDRFQELVLLGRRAPPENALRRSRL
jgi:hypothetical protein